MSSSPPPPHFVKLQCNLETEKNAETPNESSADDYVLPETNEETPRINEHLLSRLNSLLINDHEDHESIHHTTNLSQLIEEMFQTERWHELVDNVLEAIKAKSLTRQEMALRVMLSLPHGAYKFWHTNYELLLKRFLELFESLDLNIQTMTYDASVKLIPFLHIGGYDEGIDMLLTKMIIWVQRAIKKMKADIVETRIMKLVELAKFYTFYFMKQADFVFDCMLPIVEAADDKTLTFLNCQAIRIIKILHVWDIKEISRIYFEISNHKKRRIMLNCLHLMFTVEDFPTSWYKMDKGSNEFIGVSEDYSMGEFLLIEMCLYSQKDFLLTLGFDFIASYLNSGDWRKRHAAVSALGAIGIVCAEQDVTRELAEPMLNKSLSDPHHRVLCSALEVILRLIKGSAIKDVSFLKKFLPRIITVFTSTSIYPRLQFQAASIVQRLINNCGEEVVMSFSEDLIPELFKFLMLNEECRDIAMEIMRSLSSSFPFTLRRFYQKIVDSLKPFVSHDVSGEKSVECLNHVFNSFLWDQSLSVVNDAVEVFMLVFIRIVHNWTSTHGPLRLHILKALYELCQLKLVAGEHLDTIMPLLILILEMAIDPIPTTILRTEKPLPNGHGPTFLACQLLSTFAVQFEEQFAPWASRACHVLTRILESTTCPVQIKAASVKALPKVLISCQHQEEYEKVFDFTAKALVEVSLEILLEGDNLATEETLSSIVSLLNKFGAMS